MLNNEQNVEETRELLLDFQKLGKVIKSGEVIPVVVQDTISKKVLSICYVNELALKETISRKVAVFWSTSRHKLWIKGETSGDYLDIVEICVNCEQNSLLYLVKLRGEGGCHTKNNKGKSRLSCFYRSIHDNGLVNKEP